MLVVRVDRGRAWLRPVSACSGCNGCGGRCDWWRVEGAGPAGLAVPLSGFPERPVAGQTLRLALDDADLLVGAIGTYAAPLAGLLLGASIGAWLAQPMAFDLNLSTLLGAVTGTLLACFGSKPRLMDPRRLRVIGPG